MKTPIETQLRPDADTLWAGLITMSDLVNSFQSCNLRDTKIYSTCKLQFNDTPIVDQVEMTGDISIYHFVHIQIL